MKLDVGCGHSPQPGYVSVDLFNTADIMGAFWDIPLPDGCAEKIRCFYAMEHVSKFRIVDTLKEWGRLLEPDGEIVIVVPDLIWACKYFIGAPGIGFSMDILFGSQNEPGELHRIGFTEPIMADFVDQAGLVLAGVERNMDNHFENLVFHIRKSGTWMQLAKSEELTPGIPKKWRG